MRHRGCFRSEMLARLSITFDRERRREEQPDRAACGHGRAGVEVVEVEGRAIHASTRRIVTSRLHPRNVRPAGVISQRFGV